ncbi:MAG: 50S ribosomal protein L32 [Paludibaculum sp.]
MPRNETAHRACPHCGWYKTREVIEVVQE